MSGRLVFSLVRYWVAAFAAVTLYGDLGDEVWDFQTLGAVFGAPAVSETGVVFAGSRDGKMYAIRSDGTQKWAFTTVDWIDSSPTLSEDEGTIYFGSWDNRLYAVAAETGAKRWEFETGNLIACSPALDEQGNLFFGSSDGFFYSLTSAGVLRWSFYLGTELDCSPAVARDGSVYVGGYDGILYAFSNDGDSLWEFATRETEDEADRRIAGPISIGDDGEIYFGGGDGYCYALDADGELLWEFDALGKVDTGVVLGNDGEVVFASRSGYVYALDSFGALLWESFVGDVFYSAPCIDDAGRIYVGSYLGNGVSGLTVLEGTGEVVWEYLVLDYIDSSPVIDGEGRVIFGCYDGAIYALESGGSPALSGWNRFGGDGGNRSRQAAVLVSVLSERFGEWVGGLGLLGVFADPCFDGDQDGQALALEYLLGGNPANADFVGVRVFVDGAVSLALEHEVVKGDADVSYRLEYSVDGDVWLDLMGMEGVLSWVTNADAFGDGWYETRRYRLPGSVVGPVVFRMRVSCD